MCLSFYASFYACWQYLYLHIFELRPQAPSPFCPLLEVRFYWKVSFGARGLSVVLNLEVICCSRAGKCIESMGIAVGASTVVRYAVDIRYWECPLTEVPMYVYKFLAIKRTRKLLFLTINI